MELALAWLGGLALLWVPGALACRAVRLDRRGDFFSRLAMQIAFGLAVWPLLFLWTSTAGLRWTPVATRLLLTALAMIAATTWWHGRRAAAPPRASLFTGGLLLIVAVSRIVHIRGIALPLWVDSVHHTMIIRLLVEQGSIPETYAPFIPHGSFYYHWGFHSVVAQLALLLGLRDPIDLARLLLHFGQLLNALTALMAYAAGRELFGSARAGRLAAVLAALVSIFPAYYVSWGRYTHLAGTLLLPPLAIALHRSWRGGRRQSIGLAVLAGGLILVHVRVAFFALAFALAYAAICHGRRVARGLARWSAAAAIASMATAPWIGTLTRNPMVRELARPAADGSWATINTLPAELLWAPNNEVLFIAATAGAIGATPFPLPLRWRLIALGFLGAVIAAVVHSRGARRRISGRIVRRLALIAVWMVITAVALNADRLGLPRFNAVTNASALITLFLPLSLLGSGIVWWLIRSTFPVRSVAFAMGAITLAAAAYGAWTTRQPVNPSTVLARPADAVALRWIRTRTPPGSRFAVGVQPWIAGSFVGMDGGYFIPVLADRSSILPPGLYAWVLPPADAESANEALRVWSTTFDAGPATTEWLRKHGVTHVYFGPANESPLREELRTSSDFRVMYEREGVTIFELREPTPFHRP